jgi:hypothetical protein
MKATESSVQLEILHYYEQFTGLFVTEFMSWSSLLTAQVFSDLPNQALIPGMQDAVNKH